MTYVNRFDPSYMQHLNILSETERLIIEHHYSLNGKVHLNVPALAELLRTPSVSSVEVRRALAQALLKLRKARDTT